MAIIPKAVESFRSSGVAASGYNPSVTEDSGKAAGLNQIAAGMGQLAQIMEKSARIDGENNAMDMVLAKGLESDAMQTDIEQRVARKEIVSQRQVTEEWKAFEDKWETNAAGNDENLGIAGQQKFRDKNRAMKLTGMTWASVTGLEVTRSSERDIVKKNSLYRVNQVATSNTPEDTARVAYADHTTENIERLKGTTLPEQELKANAQNFDTSMQNTYVESLLLKKKHARLMYEADINFEELAGLATSQGAEVVTIKNNETGNDEVFLNIEGVLVGAPPRKELLETPIQDFMVGYPPEKRMAVANRLLREMKKDNENNAQETRNRVRDIISGNLTDKRTDPNVAVSLLRGEPNIKETEKNRLMGKVYASHITGTKKEAIGNSSKTQLEANAEAIKTSTTNANVKDSLTRYFGNDMRVIDANRDKSFLSGFSDGLNKGFSAAASNEITERDTDFASNRLKNSPSVQAAYEKYTKIPTAETARSYKLAIDNDKRQLEQEGTINYMPVPVMKAKLENILTAYDVGGEAVAGALNDLTRGVLDTELEKPILDQAVASGLPASLVLSLHMGLDTRAATEVYKGLALVNKHGLEDAGVNVNKLNLKITKSDIFAKSLANQALFGQVNPKEMTSGTREIFQAFAAKGLVNADSHIGDSVVAAEKAYSKFVLVSDHGNISRKNLPKLIVNSGKATGVQELNMRVAYLNNAVRTGKVELLPTAADLDLAKLAGRPVKEILKHRANNARTVINLDGAVKLIDQNGVPIQINAGFDYATVPQASFAPEWFKESTEGVFDMNIKAAKALANKARRAQKTIVGDRIRGAKW